MSSTSRLTRQRKQLYIARLKLNNPTYRRLHAIQVATYWTLGLFVAFFLWLLTPGWHASAELIVDRWFSAFMTVVAVIIGIACSIQKRRLYNNRANR